MVPGSDLYASLSLKSGSDPTLFLSPWMECMPKGGMDAGSASLRLRLIRQVRNAVAETPVTRDLIGKS